VEIGLTRARKPQATGFQRRLLDSVWAAIVGNDGDPGGEDCIQTSRGGLPMGVRAVACAEVTDPTHGARLSAGVRRPGRGWTLVMDRVGPQSKERKFAVREKKID